jgi:hypothetical protein
MINYLISSIYIGGFFPVVLYCGLVMRLRGGGGGGGLKNRHFIVKILRKSSGVVLGGYTHGAGKS